MGRLKRIMAVLLYLLIVSLLLGLSPGELFDLRLFLLVVAGGVILYLPSVEKADFLERRRPDSEQLARNTIYASYIETFILLFLLLSRGRAGENLLPNVLMRDIALNLRPLFYGICIWTALGVGEDRRGGRAGQAENGENAERVREGIPRGRDGTDRAWTAQECNRMFLELGLTKREAEVAVQICKGLSNKEIAMELSISETTVKKHVSNMFEKLGVKKREELWKIWME